MAVSKMLTAAERNELDAATWAYHEALMESEATLDYLEARGIDQWTAQTYRLGLVTDPLPQHEFMTGRLSIPYVVPQGGPVGCKFRCLREHVCKEAECPKYVSHAGMGQRLYNVEALRSASDTVGICEGELDAVVATEAGIPSIGVPGVKGWSGAWAYTLEGFPRILVFGDGDDAGRGFAEQLADKIEGARAVPMPDKHDVTSLVLEQGVEAFLARCG